MVVGYYAATIFPEDTPFTKMFSSIEGGNRKLREEPTDRIRTWSNWMEFRSEFLACSAVLSFQYLLNDSFVRVSFCDRSSNCFVHIPPNIPLMNSIIQVADAWVTGFAVGTRGPWEGAKLGAGRMAAGPSCALKRGSVSWLNRGPYSCRSIANIGCKRLILKLFEVLRMRKLRGLICI
jgi:hypothetical protein